MSDRELLEAAAKAAGYKRTRFHENGLFQVHLWHEGYPADWEYWNPLIDIGDAARLLLALKMRVDYVGDQPCIDGVLQSGMTAEESFCRATVRAAAALAR